MKSAKKFIIIALAFVLVVTATVAGTLAWLTSKDEVVNTFTVGKVKITLDEADVDEYGNELRAANRVKENTYRLIPGQTYVKDPTVTVKAGSDESYVRMLVTISKYSVIKEVFGNDFLPQNYVDGTWDDTVWVYNSTTENADDTITYEFRYHTTVNTSALTDDVVLPALFERFVIPGTVTGEDLEKLNAGEALKITVVAHAIQSLGFDTEDAAWTAFDAQMAENNP